MNTIIRAFDAQTWRRLGAAGFTFFLAKGLLWLVVTALVVQFG